MKKLLGLTAILVIFVLTACANENENNNGEQSVYHCTFEADDFSSTTVVEYEDIYLIRSVTTVRTYAPDFDEDYLEAYREFFNAERAELDGDYLVITLILEYPEDLLVSQFIDDLIEHGYSCE